MRELDLKKISDGAGVYTKDGRPVNAVKVIEGREFPIIGITERDGEWAAYRWDAFGRFEGSEDGGFMDIVLEDPPHNDEGSRNSMDRFYGYLSEKGFKESTYEDIDDEGECATYRSASKKVGDITMTYYYNVKFPTDLNCYIFLDHEGYTYITEVKDISIEDYSWYHYEELIKETLGPLAEHITENIAAKILKKEE